MKENQVKEHLKKKGIKESDLSTDAKEAVKMYNDVYEIHQKDQDDKAVLAELQELGKYTVAIIDATLAKKQESQTARKKVAAKKSTHRSKSMKVVKEAEEKLGDLEYCRQKIREDRKQKLESGEIKPPKKKTRVTKVKESFARILKLMPSEEPKDIEASEEALRDCARKLFKINGMNQLDFVEKELEEVREKRTPEKKEKKAA